jgi:hypothetical protein
MNNVTVAGKGGHQIAQTLFEGIDLRVDEDFRHQRVGCYLNQLLAWRMKESLWVHWLQTDSDLMRSNK